jgi:hypothetical protein
MTKIEATLTPDRHYEIRQISPYRRLGRQAATPASLARILRIAERLNCPVEFKKGA